jgi:hypothetical protein
MRRNYMLFSQQTWLLLHENITEYQERRNRDMLDAKTVNGYKVACQSILRARIAFIQQKGNASNVNSGELETCLFVDKCLDNGWTIGDIGMLAQLFAFVYKLPVGPVKEGGEALLNSLLYNKIDDMESRMSYLQMIAGYHLANRDLPGANALQTEINRSLGANINYGEYPKDRELTEQAAREGTFVSLKVVKRGAPLKEYADLYNDTMINSRRNLKVS